MKAYAKINLTLDIISKRKDGYHELETIMQTVGLFDEITITKDDIISLTCSNEELSGDKNLAFKAAKLFLNQLGINSGAKIHITKNVPEAAGLGGGSSDAAAVLNGLNILYGTKLSNETLCNMGVQLGADVPFCTFGSTMLCCGVGEKLKKLTRLPDCYITIVKDFEKISTRQLYSDYDRIGTNKSPKTAEMIEALKKKDLNLISNNLCNVFEKCVPECEKIKNIFLKQGALGSCLSGSGSSVFAIFDDENKAEKCKEFFNSKLYIVKPIEKTLE